MKGINQVFTLLKSVNDLYDYIKSLSDIKKLNIKKCNDKISLIIYAEALLKQQEIIIDLFPIKKDINLSITEIYQELLNLNHKFENLNNDNKELKEENKELKLEIKQLRNEIDNLKNVFKKDIYYQKKIRKLMNL